MQRLPNEVQHEADVSFTLQTQTGTSEELEEELDQFDQYFQSLQSDRVGLSKPERAIIRTFCAYLLGHGANNPRNAPTP